MEDGVIILSVCVSHSSFWARLFLQFLSHRQLSQARQQTNKLHLFHKEKYKKKVRSKSHFYLRLFSHSLFLFKQDTLNCNDCEKVENACIMLQIQLQRRHFASFLLCTNNSYMEKLKKKNNLRQEKEFDLTELATK